MTRTYDVEVNDGETVDTFNVTHVLDIEGLCIISVRDAEGKPVEYDNRLWRMLREAVGATYGLSEDDLEGAGYEM